MNVKTGSWFAASYRIPFYSTDRNAAALVLERIGEMGLQDRVIHNLQRGGTGLQLWHLITATPRQLMEAALAAVEEKA